MSTEILVRAFWDNEAEVWVAESDDLPGLVTEAPGLRELEKRLMLLIPDLLEANDNGPDGDIPIRLRPDEMCFVAHR